MTNLKEGFCHRRYAVWKKDLTGLSFDSQSLREWVCQEREKKWSIDACLYSYSYFFLPLVFLCVLSFSLFFLFSFSTSPSVLSTVHSYPFLYHLLLWDLPFLPLNCFWLLMGILPRLPTSLLAAQYHCSECVGCTTLHSQTKLLVLFLTSLYFCFTHLDKD